MRESVIQQIGAEWINEWIHLPWVPHLKVAKLAFKPTWQSHLFQPPCNFGLPNHCRWWLPPWNYKMFAPWKESYDQPRQNIKNQRHYFANKGPSSQSYGFSSGHVWIWELDYKENWVLKNWCFWTVVLEKTLESPLDCKEIQPVHPKGDQSWVFIGRTDVEAETPILWPPHEKSWLTGKDPNAGKDWGAGGEGDDRGWDGWMASLTQWTWVWVDSGSCWWTGRPGVLRFMGSQRVGHDWATELNWTEGSEGTRWKRIPGRRDE